MALERRGEILFCSVAGGVVIGLITRYGNSDDGATTFGVRTPVPVPDDDAIHRHSASRDLGNITP